LSNYALLVKTNNPTGSLTVLSSPFHRLSGRMDNFSKIKILNNEKVCNGYMAI
jgi:hypothetical protein